MGALYKRIEVSEGVIEYEHRVIAESILGRKLNKEEEVHHIDENKRNNSIENLMVFRTKSDHIGFHMGGTLIKHGDGTYSCNHKFKTNICEHCGNEYIYDKPTRKFCSKKCSASSRISSRKPSKEELLNLLKHNSFVKVGKMFNVSDNAVRKWCRGYDIPDKSYYYKNFT